jgi:hypothetical protein
LFSFFTIRHAISEADKIIKRSIDLFKFYKNIGSPPQMFPLYI